MVGLTLEAIGCQASIGDTCDVVADDGTRVESEVVGFSGERLYLMPTGDAARPRTECTRHPKARGWHRSRRTQAPRAHH